MGLIDPITRALERLRRVRTRKEARFDALRAQVGSLQARWVSQLGPDEIDRSEFRVFSQFGEDGIIQFLVQRVPVLREQQTFVELGVEDYREANTRFLLVNNGWRGVIVDAGTEHREFAEASELRWRTSVTPVTAFVTRDNVDELIARAVLGGEIGLLSVDIDGNDLWVFEAIESVSPLIVVTEYNSLWGADLAVTIPYDPSFRRDAMHSSGLYWGASLRALAAAAGRKGYALVAGNTAGNNAFFVRRDVLSEIPERAVADCWRPAQFSESRSPGGELTYIRDDREKLALLRDLRLVDLEREGEFSIAELYGV
jgi:hypothetical protein